MMMSFIDSHRRDLGIEPIYRELAIAPSSYHEHARRLADPASVRPVLAGMMRSRRRSSASTRPVPASTVRAMSGASCCAMVLPSPGALWNA
jgi:hypothetical protein